MKNSRSCMDRERGKPTKQLTEALYGFEVFD